MTDNSLSGGGRISPFDAIRHVDGSDTARRHYVYTLSYPDGRVFYVGKGRGDRILDHEAQAKRGVKSEKCDIIRDIWRQGGEVVKRKVAFFESDEEAQVYEQALISSLGGLTNIAPGSSRIKAVKVSSADRAYFGASIRHFRDDGSDYWSAREMADFLGYANWSPFRKLVLKVESSFARIGMDVQTHFVHTTCSVLIGHDSLRDIEDVHLSRDAFLLVLQNADVNKAMVGIGKSYIARCAVNADAFDKLVREWSRGQKDDLEPQIVLSQRPRTKLRRPIEQGEPIDPDELRERRFRQELARQQRIEEEDRLGLFGSLFEAGGQTSND